MTSNESKVLILLKDGKHYLLLNGGDRVHLVNVNDRLTEEKENQLLAMYPCSEAAMSELDISYTVIHKKDLKGVAVGGVDAGCELSLVMGKTKSKYTLSDDTTQQMIDDYFKGIKRMDASRRKLPKSPDQWRKQAQDPEILPKMKMIRYVMFALSIVSVLCFLLKIEPYKLWILLSILCSGTCLFLAIRFPEYFTLLDIEEKKCKMKYGLGIGWLTILPMVFLALRTLYMNFLQFWSMLLYAGIFAVVLMVVIYVSIKEIRLHYIGLAPIILSLLLTSVGIVGQVNYLVDTSPEEIRDYTVIDLDQRTGRRRNHYQCTIMLENGEEYRMDISREAYKRLTIGDQIQVAHREGGLGLEYIYLLEE